MVVIIHVLTIDNQHIFLYLRINVSNFNHTLMLFINLHPIFKARGIEKPYTFLVKAGISPSSANKLLKYNTFVFRLDHIELLCRVLICEPNDLLIWKPDPAHNLDKNHPLYKLIGQETTEDLQETLSKMSYKELKQTTKTIIEQKTAETQQ